MDEMCSDRWTLFNCAALLDLLTLHSSPTTTRCVTAAVLRRTPCVWLVLLRILVLPRSVLQLVHYYVSCHVHIVPFLLEKDEKRVALRPGFLCGRTGAGGAIVPSLARLINIPHSLTYMD